MIRLLSVAQDESKAACAVCGVSRGRKEVVHHISFFFLSWKEEKIIQAYEKEISNESKAGEYARKIDQTHE